MTLQALLVSKDDDASDALARAMAPFGFALERSSDPEVAAARIAEQGFDLIVIDFDEPGAASSILHLIKNQGNEAAPVVAMALVSDSRQIRTIVGAGAHFIAPKPISLEQVTASLRAAAALLKRERRRSARVPVQAAASLTLADGTTVEGILLDLSDNGMDVLAAQPLTPSTLLNCRFILPDGSFEVATEAEVAWANPNGQCGIHFLNMEEKLSTDLRLWLEAFLPELNAAVTKESVDACKLTDLSLGGCYVQTASPFPERSSVDLCLKVEALEIHAGGTVRIMHPNFGMGIEFPSRTEEQRKIVGDFIEFLTSRPGVTPELVISPKALTASDSELGDENNTEASDDPLLTLLREGNGLEQEEFLSQLWQQRNSETVNS
jgi:DNA-binding response OmpR family regulator